MSVIPDFKSVVVRGDKWTPTKYYCPMCGRQEVWESDGFDFYEGNEHACLSCHGTFRSPEPPPPSNDTWGDSAQAVLEAISKCKPE